MASGRACARKARQVSCPHSRRETIHDARPAKTHLAGGYAALATVAGRQRVSLSIPPCHAKSVTFPFRWSELRSDCQDRPWLHVVVQVGLGPGPGGDPPSEMVHRNFFYGGSRRPGEVARGREPRSGVEHEVTGVVHAHTRYSDGRGGLDQVAAAARRAGLDFLALADHNSLAARDAAGRHGAMTLLVGTEVSPPGNRDHYLVFGTEDVPDPNAPPAAVVTAVREAGGFGIVAHPDYGAAPRLRLPAYPWTDWDAPGIEAFELWTMLPDLVEGATSAAQVLAALAVPAAALRGPRPVTLARWDRAWAGGRGPVAVGAVDAHGIGLSYARSFATVRTNLWLAEPLPVDAAAATAAVVSALRQGLAYTVGVHLGDPRPLSFGVGDLGVPQPTVFRPGLIIHVAAARPALWELWGNGQLLGRRLGRRAAWPLPRPGVYRMVGRRPYLFRWRPWLFTNQLPVLAPR